MSLCTNKNSYTEEELLQYLDLELFVDRMIEMESHISSCPICQQRLAKLETMSNRSKGDAIFNDLERSGNWEKPTHTPLKFVWIVGISIAAILIGWFVYVPVTSSLNHQNKEETHQPKLDSNRAISSNFSPFWKVENVGHSEPSVGDKSATLLTDPLVIEEDQPSTDVASHTSGLKDEAPIPSKPKDGPFPGVDAQKDSVAKAPVQLKQKEQGSSDTIQITKHNDIQDTLKRALSIHEKKAADSAVAVQSPDKNKVGVITILPVQEDAPKPAMGYDRYNEYLKSSVKYPAAAFDSDLEGEIMIEFELGQDNILREFKVVKGMSKECNEMMVNVLKNGPAWETFISEDYIQYNAAKVRFSFQIMQY